MLDNVCYFSPNYRHLVDDDAMEINYIMSGKVVMGAKLSWFEKKFVSSYSVPSNYNDMEKNLFYLRTLVHHYVRINNWKELQAILPESIDLRRLDLKVDGVSPISVAFDYNRKEMVNFFIHRGAVGMNEVLYNDDGCGRTPLEITILKNQLDISNILIMYGADVNLYQLNKETPLLTAIRIENIAMVIKLLENGAKIKSVVKDGPFAGVTALHLAAQNKNPDIIKFLLSIKFFDINVVSQNNETALHFALKGFYKSSSIVELLLNAGIDINIVNTDGQVAINYLSRNDKNQVGKILKLHIIKLEQVGIKNIPQNTAEVKSSKYDATRMMCSNQADALKVMKLGNTDLTYHDVLTKDYATLALALKGNNISSLIKSRKLQNFAPMYCTLIVNRLIAIQQRNKLLHYGNALFKSRFAFFYESAQSFHKICDYLDDYDLQKFIVALK